MPNNSHDHREKQRLADPLYNHGEGENDSKGKVWCG